jgi:hypothetical protein
MRRSDWRKGNRRAYNFSKTETAKLHRLFKANGDAIRERTMSCTKVGNQVQSIE